MATSDRSAGRRYLDYLGKEIRLQSSLVSKHRPVTHLYVGGGTPTFLEGAELTELMHLLATNFKLNDNEDREYVMEVDPRTADKFTLPLLKGLGFNGLRFGVQDFDDTVQSLINRKQPLELVKSVLDTARLYQFDTVSFQMIYGLPGANSPESGKNPAAAGRPDARPNLL